MRHRLRDRPKAAAGSARSRRRERRSRLAAPGEGSAPCEGELLSELSELLSVEEGATWWQEEEQQRPEDSSLSDLLQQLVAADDEASECGASPAGHVTPAARGRCPGNRNAEAARLNRLRKKEYVSGLEGRLSRLCDDNARLERERRALGLRVRELEAEARYLRAVLANDSALCQLLGRLTGLGGVRLATSLFRDPPVKLDDHDYALPGLVTAQEEEEEAPPAGGGVCLHVDKEKVSVEFCPACARSAASAAKM